MASDRNGNAHRVVLIDTNGFVSSGQFCLDIFGEITDLLGKCTFVTIAEIKDELRGLGKGNGKDAAAARFGLQLLEKCDILQPVPYSSGSVDDKIVLAAQEHRCYVVTNDKELKQRLLSQGVAVIVVRGKKKLEIIRK
ncbi:MAG: nucleotide-binding protein [Euryarchaeota archaeon]|nr:nucleotide-binding protein [Euryarchaeota archaeon]